MVRVPFLFAVGAVTVLVAAGCGAASNRSGVTRPAGTFPIVVAHPKVRSTGLPRSTGRRVRGNRAVLLSPSSVAFRTTATISCAWWPARLTAVGPSSIRVDMRVNGVVSRCGSGALGFPIAVQIPGAVDVHKPVTVRVAYKVRLPNGGGTRQWHYTAVAPPLSRP
jgi:hypothetical protein